MKKAIFILAIYLIVMAESSGQRQAGADDVITVDVRKTYSPKKELILQDLWMWSILHWKRMMILLIRVL